MIHTPLYIGISFTNSFSKLKFASIPLSFPGVSVVKNLPAKMQETQVWSLGWEDLQENGKATHSSIFAWVIA